MIWKIMKLNIQMKLADVLIIKRGIQIINQESDLDNFQNFGINCDSRISNQNQSS